MCEKTSLLYNASANSTCAHPLSSRATAGHLPALLVRGWGISKFCMTQGWTFVTPRLLTRTWFVVVVPFQCIQLNMEDFAGNTSRLAYQSRTEKLFEVFKGKFSQFYYTCISSLLINIQLMKRNRELSHYWIKTCENAVKNL